MRFFLLAALVATPLLATGCKDSDKTAFEDTTHGVEDAAGKTNPDGTAVKPADEIKHESGSGAGDGSGSGGAKGGGENHKK